jgi:conjugative relaxase-like TrwC/TraI family protein
MLGIEQSFSAKAATQYFAEHLSRGDYYSQGGARPGVWFGKGAERLGLAGEVTAHDFGAVAGNRNPLTGERLTVRDAANRRAGYDFTFSPPKSFSAMWARTGDARLPEALQQAVAEWLREDVEPEVKTRVRRSGQERDVTVGNLVASLFLHDTSRPLKEDGKPDPQLHMHVYVHNVCWAEHEGRWQAVQFGTLKADGPYLEAALEARLAAKVRSLGYDVARDGKGRWEMTAVLPSVNQKFSRRRFGEVLPEAERRGITDGEGRSKLGRLTRQGKAGGEPLATAELRAYWNSKLTGDETAPMDAAYARAVAGGGAGGPAAVTARGAVDHALAHFFGPDGRNSCEAEQAVLEEALRFGAGGVLPAEAKRELAGRDLIRAEISGRMVCTTQEVLAEEQAMVKSARAGCNSCSPLAAGKRYVPDKDLDKEQQAAVSQFLASQDRLLLLVGKAGAGKTTALRALDAALHERGRRLAAFAPTARASRGVLRAKGFTTADTVANLLDPTKRELREQVHNNVILIDEAGLLGTRALRQVLELAEKQDARVLLVGDPQQHRGVPRGQVLNIVQDQAGITPARLTTIRRQQDPDYRRAVELLSVGKAAEAFDLLDRMGFIQEIDDPEERYRALARDDADRLAAGDSRMIVAPTHAEGRVVAAAVRAELRARGLLGAQDHTLVRYESKQLTIAQRKDAAQYQEGDTIQWNQHAPGFQRGERLTVVGREEGCLTVQDSAGQAKELPLALAERFELYRTERLAVADGERLRVTRNGYVLGPDGKQRRLNNGDVITVRVTPEGELIDQRGWRVPASYGHLAHGVVTSHASQGAEDKVPFLAQSTASRGAASAEQFYVSVSRGKQGLRVYTDDKEALRAAVVRSEHARSAAEVWQASQRQRQAGRAGWEQLARRQKRRRGVLATVRAARDRLVGQWRELTEALPRRQEPRGLGHAPS